MPAVPGRAQVPPSSGVPDGVKVAAVRSAGRSAGRGAWRPGPVGWSGWSSGCSRGGSLAVPLASRASRRPVAGRWPARRGRWRGRRRAGRARTMPAAVAGGCQRSEGEVLARPERGNKRRPRSGQDKAAVVGGPRRGDQFPALLPAGRMNSCQKLLCGRPAAHHRDGPGARGGDQGGGQERAGGAARVAGREPAGRCPAAAAGARRGRQGERAADWLLMAAPAAAGRRRLAPPRTTTWWLRARAGVELISCRMWPSWSMTKA